MTPGTVLVAAVAVVLAGALGCTPAPPAVPDPSPSASPTTPNTHRGEACAVPLPESWQAAFEAGMFPREPGEYPYVKLIAPDGSLLVEYGHLGVHHEVRWMPADGGPPVVVQAFGPDESEAQVLGASFDGRYLAYSVTWSFRLFSSAWTLYVWDSHSGGEPRAIAHSRHDEAGEPLPGPLLYPVAHEGTVAWVQPTGEVLDDPQHNALYLYRVADERLDVAHTGHSTYPVRFGSLLIFGESPAPGELTRMHALELDTGEIAAAPDVLAEVAGAAYWSAGDDTIAWIDSERKAVWVWRSGWDEPWQAISSWQDDYVEWVNVAGDVLAWHGTVAQFALDLRSGSYTQITPEFGSQSAGGPYLHIGFYPGRLSSGQPLPSEETIVDTRTLPPLPRCT